MLRITRKNFKEVITAVVKGRNGLEYDRQCFSKNDIRLETIADNELGKVMSVLQEDGINLYLHVRPIYIKEGLGWNEETYNEEFYKKFKKDIPEEYQREIKCPYIEEYCLKDMYSHLLIEEK